MLYTNASVHWVLQMSKILVKLSGHLRQCPAGPASLSEFQPMRIFPFLDKPIIFCWSTIYPNKSHMSISLGEIPDFGTQPSYMFWLTSYPSVSHDS